MRRMKPNGFRLSEVAGSRTAKHAWERLPSGTRPIQHRREAFANLKVFGSARE